MSDVKLSYDRAKKYGYNFYALISQNVRSYAGFVPMLKELLQNSDDSSDGEKVEIQIYFLKDKLKLRNNTIFIDRDWEKIREIASQNKEEDSRKTGRFGIGFTSVFKICDSLDIHSNNISENLSLESLDWVPYEKPQNTENYTEFDFYWRFEKTKVSEKIKADPITPQKIETFIDETLEQIQKDIHFLRNVSKISIYRDEKLIQEIVIEKDSENIGRKLFKEIKTITVNNKNISKLLIYHKDLTTDFVQEHKEGISRKDELLLSIAIYKSEIKEGRIFCTLPTENLTDLDFDINSDFQPATNRKHLILEEDDDKGLYNLKLLGFIPSILFDILDDLKTEIPAQIFYKIISNAANTFEDNKLYSDNDFDFISEIGNNDSEIILINDEWHSISDSKFMEKSPILSFLKRIEYPIIPDEYLEFLDFFKEIGVEPFNISHLINLIQKEIPNSVSFDESVFESKEELKSIFNYLKPIDFDNIHNIHNTQSLNIFLTESGVLHNTNNTSIYEVPKSLSLIKKDLSINIIDECLDNDFRDLLLKLGIKKFLSDHLIDILIKDVLEKNYPVKLSKSEPYINSIEKINTIINFIDNYLKKSSEFKNDPLKLIYDEHRNVIAPQTEEYKKRKSLYDKLDKLPIVLSEDNQLYPLEYITYNLDSDIKKRFALKYNIQDIQINPKIKELLARYDLSRNLDLKTIFNFVKNGSQDYTNDLLILLYELIMEGEFQIKDNAIKTTIRTLPIFRNNKGNLCSLEDNGKMMKLPGVGYSDPIGVEEILDEELINSVQGFKEIILKRYFEIEELNFGIYIKDYFIDIFENEDVGREDKLQLIKTLMEQYHILERNVYFVEINEILKKTKMVYCQDNKFHYLNEKYLFFKSEEIDNFFGDNYLYPNFDDNNKYEYLLEKLGLKKELHPKQIVDHIETLIEPKKLDEKLFEKLKNILRYIEEKWDSFNHTGNFNKLADIEWLPAKNDNSKLYKPSKLFTQDTKPFLVHINGILYLDSNTPKKKIINEIVDCLALTNIPKIPTEKIIQNIRIASEGTKILDKYFDIYKELNRRVEIDKDRILKLKEFPSLYIKYEGEDKPRYFSYLEVFTKDYYNEFGYDYIGYLNSKFVEECNKLIKLLDISEEPTEDTLKDILEKIEFKYKKNGYCISSLNDYIIIEKCLKRLNQYDILNNISELRIFHILTNSENKLKTPIKLITPIDAVLNDRPSLYDEFKIELKDYLINYPKEYYGLFDKLNIKRLSQIINKVLEDKPDLNQLTINEDFSKKLRDLSKVIPRIKAHKIKLKNDDWKSIDSKITVYDFDNLNVTRNVILHNCEFRSNKKNINCYIDKDTDTNCLSKIYVKGSREDILKSLGKEIVEELHPELDTDFRGIIDSLLQKESSGEMNEKLNEFDYPPVEDKATSLNIPKQTEEEYKDSGEKEDGAEYPEIPINGSIRKDDKINDKTIDKSLHQREKELEIQLNTEEESHSKESKVARTSTPKNIKDAKETIKKTYNKKPGQISEPTPKSIGIVESSEPMSLEEVKEYINNIDKELNSEIETIIKDNNNRTYKLRLEPLISDEVAKLEVKSWYENKCQICGYTFKKKDGTNHSNVVPLQPIRNKGIRHPSNFVCLCPNHAAIIKEGYVEIKDLDLKGNKVIVEAKGVFKDKYIDEIYEIKCTQKHFLMLKSMLVGPIEPDSMEESINISEKTDINFKIDPISLLKQAFDLVVEEDGWAFLSDLGQEVRKLDYSFDPKNYGYKKLFELIQAHPNVFKVTEFENKKGPSIVKIRYK